jgi:hypothetical protein
MVRRSVATSENLMANDLRLVGFQFTNKEFGAVVNSNHSNGNRFKVELKSEVSYIVVTGYEASY